MSAKKYILHPNGQIKVVTTDDNNPYDEKSPGNVTQEILENQEDFFSNRTIEAPRNVLNLKVPASNFLPTGAKGLVSSAANLNSNRFNNTNKETGIISRETPEFLKDSLFPKKDDSNILINPSFGADTDLKYYRNYNSAFALADMNKNIYAEELEMLAGIEFNSLGIVASAKGIDLTMFAIVFDYILELTTYISAAIAIIRTNNFAPTAVIRKYFTELLQFKSQHPTSSNFSSILDEFLTSFVIGLNEYVNADPKLGKYKIKTTDFVGLAGYFQASVEYLKNTLNSLSKVGRNRVFLLIRKFQQESYWHSEILYKAKSSDDKLKFVLGRGSISPENSIDRFFSEFSQYYFKFFIERVYIGRLIQQSNETTVITKNNYFKTYNFNTNTYNRHTGHIYKKHNISTSLTDPDTYEWKENNKNEKSQTKSYAAITRLPQLLKTTAYFSALLNAEVPKISGNFGFNDYEEKRFNLETISKIERALENEYMPFYFHDIRTNEILSFHAFLDSITDNFNPEYTSTSGYGRIDDVKHYIKTTRNINLTFNLVSYNSEDHDLMWYQINKLVSLVYPQWSQGIPSNAKKADGSKIMPENFRFPFTQVPTASPLIRLRVGDVLKSNYSETSFARLHGHKVVPKTVDETIKILDTNIVDGGFFDDGKEFGIFNNLIINYTTQKLDGDNFSRHDTYIVEEYAFNSGLTPAIPGRGNHPTQKFFNLVNDVYTEIARQAPTGYTTNPVLRPEDLYTQDVLAQTSSGDGLAVKQGQAIEKFSHLKNGTLDGNGFVNVSKQKKYEYENVTNKYKGKIFDYNDKSHSHIPIIIKVKEIAKSPTGKLQKTARTHFYCFFAKIPVTVVRGTIKARGEGFADNIENVKNITDSETSGDINNPFAKSFESTKGKGLAGFITMLDVGYSDSTWETNNPGKNAPHVVKIGINFSPIHDIAPGIDHEGVLRAPVYPAGKAINNIYSKDLVKQDPIATDFVSSTRQTTITTEAYPADA